MVIHALTTLWLAILSTLRDVFPILMIIVFFQLAVLRRPFTNLPRLAWGTLFVVLGLTFFLMGLQLALFPLGEEMAAQLVSKQDAGIGGGDQEVASWYHYYWTFLFAFAIGVSTTIAEPSLIAVAIKAEEVSGGAIQAWGLRLAVAVGVGVGVALGTFRIVIGAPLPYFILTGYVVVIIQTWLAPKPIVPLAYDSGGVATSTVSVPLIAMLGLGLASRVPGRDPVIDGFGLIAFAVLFPMMTVMGYAQIASWNEKRRQRRADASADGEPRESLSKEPLPPATLRDEPLTSQPINGEPINS